jgi:signal transduction histidine kinase/DNA-binding NarL/FixJ family response regulator
MDFITNGRESTLKHYRLLLVDDNPEEVASIRRLLSRSLHARFDVTHANWMSAALRALQTSPFDVVLADLFLPDRSGVDIITELHEQAPNVPIVAMARIGTERMASEALRAGADDYFQLEAETAGESNLLVRTVRHVIERKRLANRLNFLHEATDTLSASLDLDATMDAIGDLVVPRVADCCILEFLDGSGTTMRAAVCGFGPRLDTVQVGEDRHLAAFTDDTSEQHLAWSPVVPQVLSGGKAELFEQIDDRALQALAHTAGHYQKLQALDIRSIIVAPLTSGGNSLGTLSLVTFGERRGYATDDLPLVEEFARRCAVALDNALLYEKVERALEAQEELLARVSHDLRTPLTSIRAGLGLLAMNVGAKLSANETALLDNAKRGAERLGILVNDLLAHNEISRDSHLLDIEPIDLRALVEEVVMLLKPLVQGKDQQMRVDLPEPIPFKGNGKLLVQALTNLLDNAHMHTPTGTEIAITSRVTPTAVVLAISDDGPGIPLDLHKAIFERFYKAPSARRGRGLGLGLTIARSVVEMHGGSLWVDSTPGEGTTFFISLPRPVDEEVGTLEGQRANREGA